MTFDAWLIEFKSDLPETNEILVAEGLTLITEKMIDDFAVVWRRKHEEDPTRHPLDDEGCGDVFFNDLFEDWEETGTVNEEDLREMFPSSEELDLLEGKGMDRGGDVGFKVSVIMDDGGPVDGEHMKLISLLVEGTSLEEVNRRLALCKRTATVFLGEPAIS